jgi:hypothetical protein
MGMEWGMPIPIPSSLGDLLSLQPEKPRSGAEQAFFQAQPQFEAAFVKAYIPAAPMVAPSADVKPIPVADLAGSYWTQLAKGTRYILLELTNRLVPTTKVEDLLAQEAMFSLSLRQTERARSDLVFLA